MNIFYYNFKKINNFFLIILITICLLIPSIFYYLELFNQKKIDTTINSNINNRKITIYEKNIDLNKIKDIEHVSLVVKNYYTASIEYNDEEVSLKNIELYNGQKYEEDEIIIPRYFQKDKNDILRINNYNFRIAELTNDNHIYMNNKYIEKMIPKNNKEDINYLIITDDYQNTDYVYEQLIKDNIEANKNLVDTSKIDNLKRIIERINIFKIITNIMSILIIIEIFLYIYREEIKNISLLRILGYSNIRINNKLYCYINFLMIISIFINTIISIIINKIISIKKIYNVGIIDNLIYNKTQFLIYLVIMIIIYFIYLHKIKKTNALEML